MPRLKPKEHTTELIRHRLIQGFNASMDRDAAAVDRQLDAMAARVRVLKYDEGAKAKLTVVQDSHGNVIVNTRSTSAAQLVADSAIWNEHTEVEETKKDHLIPRKSLTSKLFLRLFDPVLEFRDVQTKQLTTDVRTQLAKIAKLIRKAHPDNRKALAANLLAKVKLEYVTVTNPRLAWKSDNTLLRTNRPDSLKTVAVKRVSSRTKERTFEKETDDLPTWDESTPRTWDDEHPKPTESL